MPKQFELDPGVTEWKDGLRETGLTHVIPHVVDHPKRTTLEYMRLLGLPSYSATIARADALLANPEPYFDELGAETAKYFVALEHQGTLQRMRDLDLDRAQVMSFVENTPSSWGLSTYNVFLRQYFPTKYMGAITVDKLGNIHSTLELRDRGDLADDSLTMQKKVTDGKFHYSFNDVVLRSLMYRATQCVPHDDQEYLRGLYEYVIDEPEPSQPLRYRFLDYFPEY